MPSCLASVDRFLSTEDHYLAQLSIIRRYWMTNGDNLNVLSTYPINKTRGQRRYVRCSHVSWLALLKQDQETLRLSRHAIFGLPLDLANGGE